MITESTIYWITRLDCIVTFCTLLSIISAVVAAILGIGNLAAMGNACTAKDDEDCKKIWKVWRIIFCFGLVTALIAVFTPTTKEMAMIKIIPAIANSKFMAEDLPNDARQLYELSKKALIEKLTDEKETKK